MYFTFKEWNDKGYRVKRGAKAVMIDGEFKFSSSQVWKPDSRNHKRRTRRHPQYGDGNPDCYEGDFDQVEAFQAVWGD